jgi:hypothetical protein
MTVHIDHYSEELTFSALASLKSIAGSMGLDTNVAVEKFSELEHELTELLAEKYGLSLGSDGVFYTLATAEGVWLDEWQEALWKLKGVLTYGSHIIVGCDEGIGIVCITPDGMVKGKTVVTALIALVAIESGDGR